MNTLGELATESSMTSWTLTGGTRLVKVCSPTAAQAVEKYGSAMGYVTQEKYLYGKSCTEIERLLGLRPFELRNLAYIFSLARLPRMGEFEFRFSTAFPAGKPFEKKQADEMMQARQDYLDHKRVNERSIMPVQQYYPPGSAMIPQWELTTPIAVAGLVATVTATVPLTRDNGSIKEYTPHNRGPIR